MTTVASWVFFYCTYGLVSLSAVAISIFYAVVYFTRPRLPPVFQLKSRRTYLPAMFLNAASFSVFVILHGLEVLIQVGWPHIITTHPTGMYILFFLSKWALGTSLLLFLGSQLQLIAIFLFHQYIIGHLRRVAYVLVGCCIIGQPLTVASGVAWGGIRVYNWTHPVFRIIFWGSMALTINLSLVCFCVLYYKIRMATTSTPMLCNFDALFQFRYNFVYCASVAISLICSTTLAEGLRLDLLTRNSVMFTTLLVIVTLRVWPWVQPLNKYERQTLKQTTGIIGINGPIVLHTGSSVI